MTTATTTPVPTPTRFSSSSTHYHCPHLSHPHPPLPPSYLSSSSTSFHPLSLLLFCEECDAIRCPHCVASEIASYFCPNCLFDVPSANVRNDKNRCARSCFECPVCETALSTLAVEAERKVEKGREEAEGGEAAGGSGEAEIPAGAMTTGAQYLLACPSCKWSSRQVGIEFEKPTGLASQLAKLDPQPDRIQSEFDALKDHLESYITVSSPSTTSHALGTRGTGSSLTPASRRAGGSSSSAVPSRHISHLTQMAAKALHKPVPGMARSRLGATGRGAGGGAGGEKEREKEKKAGWDEVGEYVAKKSWKGGDEVEEEESAEGLAPLDRRWAHSWATDNKARSLLPQRIPLLAKITKRCPEPSCRHLLIQPDLKSVRMKIKMVAGNYLPAIELGRRRRRVLDPSIAGGQGVGGEEDEEKERERRRKERRRTRGLVQDVDEAMEEPLVPGEMYTFQIAFTNPLYDPIQIRLSPAHQPKPPSPPLFHLSVPVPHFTVGPLKDAWAYVDDGDDEGEDGAGVDEFGVGVGEEQGSIGSVGRRSNLGPVSAGSGREKRGREGTGVEKKGNVSKVGLELDVYAGAKGPIQADLEVRYTYRAEDPVAASTPEKAGTGHTAGASASASGGPSVYESRSASGATAVGEREEFKTFTFWIRVEFGIVQ